MGVGKCGELESQELSIFGNGSGDLVVDRAAAGKELLGEPSPQTGEFVERFGHEKTLPDHCSRIGARPKRRNGVAPGDGASGQGLPMNIVTRCYRDTMRLHDSDYEDLLTLRTGLRRIVRWSDQVAEEAGLTPAQHQLLIAIRGHRDRRGPTVGEVADYLLLRHHSAVGLVDRAVAAGLVKRVRDAKDQRVVRLQLTSKGRTRLESLSELHRAELERLSLKLPSAWRGLMPRQPLHGIDVRG